MIKKNFYLSLILSLFLFSQNQLIANDVADMSGISEAAGESAAAAANQLSNDTGAITTNISSVTEALGAATTEVGAKLDVSIAQAQAAMDFATQSIEAGNLTAAVQTMSLVESVADMALSSVPNPWIYGSHKNAELYKDEWEHWESFRNVDRGCGILDYREWKMPNFKNQLCN